MTEIIHFGQYYIDGPDKVTDSDLEYTTCTQINK